jgi:hypothetical protein
MAERTPLPLAEGRCVPGRWRTAYAAAPPTTRMHADSARQAPRQPSCAIHAAASSGPAMLPAPMPATARPEAKARLAPNQGCTAPTEGTYTSPTPMPMPML